jgi:DNA repair protein RadA/Sms
MAAKKIHYECSACGQRSAKWLGHCGDCGEWNSFIEVLPEASPDPRRAPRTLKQTSNRPVPASQAPSAGEDQRLSTGIGELDRILGGGLVPGSVTLIGGSPGVGKSTLLMQAALGVSGAGRPVLYVSGEESVPQVRSRSLRLGEPQDLLFLLAETDLSRALEGAEQIEPDVLIVDSVQTTFVPEIGGTPGGINQVREVAARLVLYAKATGRAVLLVGHVTKGGQLAGPRTLEHVVDTVIYFEGDANPPFRVLRAEKNRFGATGELALFEMTDKGLQEVAEPSAALIADRPIDRPGTVVTSALEGSRTLLLEIQALVAPGFPGSTRRTALGIDGGRLAMLVAVLGKADYALGDKDIFVNVVGGVRVHEPAADLAVAAAITSSLFNRVIGGEWLIIGEVGLTGELRSVPRLEQRLNEGARHGFRKALVPRLPGKWSAPRRIECVPCGSLEEAMQTLTRP